MWFFAEVPLRTYRPESCIICSCDQLFYERASNGHHLFLRFAVCELINLQKDGSKARPYQVRQAMRVAIEDPVAGRPIMDRDEVIIDWSNRDHAFAGKVPELSGRAAHAKIRNLALREIRTAKKLWTTAANEFGAAVPKPAGRQLMFA